MSHVFATQIIATESLAAPSLKVHGFSLGFVDSLPANLASSSTCLHAGERSLLIASVTELVLSC